MVCVFYGHRECGEEIVPSLETVLKALIEEKGVDRFYVGTQGGFDDAVYRTLKTMRRHYPHIEYKRVLAYLPTALEQGVKAEQVDTLIPAGIETRPPRYRILYRNEWMLRQADYVVVYTVTSARGAAKFAALARKRGIPCINLAEN